MLAVRPFAPADAADWDVLEGEPPQAVATWRGTVVGAIFLQGQSIDWIVARILHERPVLRALVGWARSAVGSPLGASTFGPTLADPQEAAYRELGFRPLATLVHVERSITGLVAAAGDLELVPYAAVDPAAFLSLFSSALEGTPNRLANAADPAAQLAEIRADSDTRLWTAVHRNGRGIGVILPRIDRTTGVGMMAFIGVVAAARGKGLGGRLHRVGLARLTAAGVSTYHDVTDAENRAMRRVFARNGCRMLGFEHRYEWKGH